jgi:RNA recognition motif-containing protein
LFEHSGGKVESVRLITDFDTGRSKGYAFVEMATADEAGKAARELHEFNLNGRSLVVNEARPRHAWGTGPRRGPR